MALTILFMINTAQFNLPTGLLSSVCFIESSYNINAVHKDDGGTDSLGVCQIKYSTAKWLGFKGSKRDLMEPSVNVYYAAKYLNKNLKRYQQNSVKAIIAYNKGNANNLTTTRYSRRVLRRWEWTIKSLTGKTCQIKEYRQP